VAANFIDKHDNIRPEKAVRMAYTTMLAQRRLLPGGLTIGEGLSPHSRASALLRSYSHKVWNSSNTSESLPFDDIDNVYRPTESILAIRDSIDNTTPEQL
jgi:hypothetical protein